MSETVTAQEKAEFIRKHFGVSGDKAVIRERKRAPFIRVGSSEYRAAHLALPPAKPSMTADDWQLRLELILAEVDRSERAWRELEL
jgi:hypothetical protein